MMTTASSARNISAFSLCQHRLRLQEARHDENIEIEIVHDHHRLRALQFRGDGEPVRQHEGGGNGMGDVAPP